jgi:hypothetical protein
MATLSPIDVTHATSVQGHRATSECALPGDVVPTTVVVEPDAAAGGVVVATDVVGTVPVMGVWSFFELEQPATTAALRARAAMNTLIPREVMV